MANPILELGAGTGRVALHLARRGYTLDAVELDHRLASILDSRAELEQLAVEVRTEDVRDGISGGPYSLVIGAMQLIQLLEGCAGRRAALEGMARSLAPGGVAALAIVEGTESVVGMAGESMLPDARERDGWVYSSLPLDVVARDGQLVVRRLRQTVSPKGDLEEFVHTDLLDVLDASTLEREAAAANLVPAGRHPIADSDSHVGSTVVLLERER